MRFLPLLSGIFCASAIVAAAQKKCSSPSDCTTGYCDRGICGAHSGGESCSANTDCLSKSCVGGVCARGAPGAVCRTGSDCMEHESCKLLKSNGLSTCTELYVETRPLLVGQECYGDHDCSSSHCVFDPPSARYDPKGPAGACGTVGLNSTCGVDTDCTSLKCQVFVHPPYGYRCVHSPPGTACTLKQQKLCASRICDVDSGQDSGVCAPSKAGTYCKKLGDCEAGYACLKSKCVPSDLPNGSACTYIAQCQSRNCNDKVCQARGPPGTPCSRNHECISGLCQGDSGDCSYP